MDDASAAHSNATVGVAAGKKRPREEDADLGQGFVYHGRADKKARPTSVDSEDWPRDSVNSTPINQAIHEPHARTLQTKNDSDDQSSMMSEPGSPRDIDMSSGDEYLHNSENDADHDDAMFSEPGDDLLIPHTRGRPLRTGPNNTHRPYQQSARVPTPMISHQPRPGIHPLQLRAGTQHHVRSRHPQENLSSAVTTAGVHLGVPSPVDEDEVPTPPSAAEAAGSQLSMLSVSDMEVEDLVHTPVPAIALNTPVLTADSRDIDVEPIDSSTGFRSTLMVHKQRSRSGALSSGHGSPSPVRMTTDSGVGISGGRRGFSMGFRADCEKCQSRVPGHMNHFLD